MTPRPVEILLVEDTPGDIWLIRETLQQGAVQKNIHVVTNGEQALDFLRQRGRFSTAARPDLVLLDLNLPRRDGFEVLREIKNDPVLRPITVVVLTTSNAPSDVNAAYDLNANCYVVKPVDLEEFTRTLRGIEHFWMSLATLPTLAPQGRSNEGRSDSVPGGSSTNGENPASKCRRSASRSKPRMRPVRYRRGRPGRREPRRCRAAWAVWAMAICLWLSASNSALGAAIPVILDTDIGDDIDDALALSLALQSPELNVLAVTTVLQDGNRRADLVWKILELYGRTGIPVGVGAEQPLMARPRTGIVRQTEALAATDRMPADRRHNGLELLIDTCFRSPDKVTLVAYGPLTNIAIALRAEPRLRERLDRIVLMNGVFFRPGLEYNTKIDPEASAIVYSSGVPVLAVGLDVTTQCRLSAEHLRQFAASKLDAVQFLWKLIQIWQNGNAEQRPVLHDPLAVAVTIKPDLVTTVRGTVDVETHGLPDRTYGMTVYRTDPGGATLVAQEVGAAAAVDFFVSRVLAPPVGTMPLSSVARP